MIVVFGSINVDLFFETAELPRAGETVLGTALAPQPGGKGANQALACALDGAQVALAGAVGQDHWAEIALAELRAGQVDLTYVRETPAPTGLAIITKDALGQNQIIVAPGANLQAKADDVDPNMLSPAATLLLQMECDVQETERLISQAAQAGAQIILNLAPAAKITVQALREVTYLVVNETEAEWLADYLRCEPNAKALQAVLDVSVIRTLGAKGAELAQGANLHRLPAPNVNVTDTTAAGDCFVGVFAASLDRGLTPEKAMARAISAASLCCTRKGSQSSLPRKADIDAFIMA
jgi:ribokinase